MKSLIQNIKGNAATVVTIITGFLSIYFAAIFFIILFLNKGLKFKEEATLEEELFALQGKIQKLPFYIKSFIKGERSGDGQVDIMPDSF